ncbi:MAG: hypothetical protein WCD79_20000 [Chthoniobacteraceae bacterium]
MKQDNIVSVIKTLLVVTGLAILSGCATDNKQASSSYSGASYTRSNLDEADRSNHNSLLPASFYESNHEVDD